MSVNGSLVSFSETEPPDPSALLRSVLDFLGPQSVAAFRSRGENREWEQFQADLERPFEAVEITDDDDEYFAKVATIDAPGLFRAGTCLHLLCHGCRVGPDIADAIAASIPESIRGSFLPGTPDVRIGWHDIFESSEHDTGHLFGRAFLSVTLFGYGTPHNWGEYRRLVTDVAAVQSLRQSLEALGAGPIRQCVYWSV